MEDQKCTALTFFVFKNQFYATHTGANVLSFQFASGHDITVLVSKNAGRYRLQSDALEAMWMVSCVCLQFFVCGLFLTKMVRCVVCRCQRTQGYSATG